MWCGAIWKAELSKQTLEVVFIVVGYIPEDGLEISCSCWLIDGVDDLFKAIGYDFIDASMLF